MGFAGFSADLFCRYFRHLVVATRELCIAADPGRFEIVGCCVLITLKKRAEFRRAATGAKVVGRYVVVNFYRRPSDSGECSPSRPCETIPHTRFGFTITRAVGCAVVRNRVRRRMRAIVRSQLSVLSQTRGDFVIIARHTSTMAPFQSLEDDLKSALHKVRSRRQPRKTRKSPIARNQRKR